MKRELTPKEVQGIIKQENECGVNTLLQELLNCQNPVVIADVDENGGIGFYDVKDREENATDKPPVMIENKELDLSKLKKQLQDYVERTDCKHEDCDCQHYIFEEAVNTFYGKDIWDYINSLAK